jgi:NADH-quinone oxidoreductase subunit H
MIAIMIEVVEVIKTIESSTIYVIIGMFFMYLWLGSDNFKMIFSQIHLIKKEILYYLSKADMLYLCIKSISLILLLLGMVAFFILVERNVIGSIQRRKGPNVVGVFGLLQSVADGFKLIAKENVIPSSGNPGIFTFSPVITMFIGLGSWAVIPFCSGGVLSNINLGVLFLFALSSIGVYAIIMAGWSSNSKYAFLGAIRSAAQMISYEVSFGLSLIVIFIIVGSLNLSDIIYFQQAESGGIWFIFPLFPFFLIFFISILAETNRHPFDLPEAEAELVSGYNIEYSSMTFALFFLGEYLSILNMCALGVCLFFGGWDPIIPGLDFIPESFWFIFKVWVLGVLFVVIRCVLPRYRYDQLISLGWRQLIPLCMGLVLIYVAFFFVYGLWFF